VDGSCSNVGSECPASNRDYDSPSNTHNRIGFRVSLYINSSQAPQEPPKTEITFSIAGTTLKAEEGMTWSEWINSSYNVGSHVKIVGENVCEDGNYANVNGVLYHATNGTKPDSIIIAGADYSSMCCFVKGTQITTTLEGNTASIETLKPGDKVVSYDIKNNKNYYTEVTSLVTNRYSINMAKVYFENGSFVEMTDYHPLYTKNGFHSITNINGYDTLVVGDIVKTFDGWSKVTKIERYTTEPITTYTLMIRDFDEDIDNDENDNYYANGIAAHNAGMCILPGGIVIP